MERKEIEAILRSVRSDWRIGWRPEPYRVKVWPEKRLIQLGPNAFGSDLDMLRRLFERLP